MTAIHVVDPPTAGAPEALCDLARCVPGLTRRMGAAHAALLLHPHWPPAWWLNLQAAGEGLVVLASERRPIVPRLAIGAERERLWERFCAMTPLEHYQRRCRRTLPIVVLTRRPATMRSVG